LSELFIQNEKEYDNINAKIHSGIIKNYIESNKFWEKYSNGLEPAFKNSFNAFLKANSQQNGIRSYGYVVTLLVNYYKDKEL
jgi:hypothetical protein